MNRPVNDDNGYTFDNAIGALGKVIYFQSELDKGTVLAGQFLSLLPVKNDLEESEAIVKLLLNETLNKNPVLVNDTVLPQVINAVKRINEFRQKEEEILDEEGLALLLIFAQNYQLN
jgi:hypothetical protein